MTTAGQREAWHKVFHELAEGDTVTQICAIASLVILEREIAVNDWKDKRGPEKCALCGDRHANSPCISIET